VAVTLARRPCAASSREPQFHRPSRRAGRSYRDIATALDAEGHKLRRAASWSAAAVRDVALQEIAG
jgi:hypothetical protein